MTLNRMPSFHLNSRLHIFAEAMTLAEHLSCRVRYEQVTPVLSACQSLWFQVQLYGEGEALIGIPEGSGVTGYAPRASRIREFLSAFVRDENPAFTVLDFGEWQPPEDVRPYEICFWREDSQLPFHFLFLSLRPTVGIGERLTALISEFVLRPRISEFVLVAEESTSDRFGEGGGAARFRQISSEIQFKNSFWIEGDTERRYFVMKEDEGGLSVVQQALVHGAEGKGARPPMALPTKVVLEPLQMPLEDYLALAEGDEIELGAAGKVPATLFTGGVATARGYLTLQNDRCIFRISDCEEIFAVGGNNLRKNSIHQVDSPFQQGGHDDE